MVDDAGGRLINSSQLAAQIGVTRPTITMWGKRHRGFPPAHEVDGTKWYDVSDLFHWLDGHVVPRKHLKPEESIGTTYGDRLRRNRPRASTSAPSAGAPEDLSTLRRDLGLLLGPLGGGIRGSGNQADYLQFLLGLAFTRVCAPDLANRLLPDRRDLPARAVLRHAAAQIDAALRRAGIAHGMRGNVERLAPVSARDVRKVIESTTGLGREGFRRLLRRCEAEVRSDALDAFTPPSVARLMAHLLLASTPGVMPLTIYDPYIRGGELESEAALVHPGARPRVRGRSPRIAHLHLAAMNLVVHGCESALKADSSPPWEDPAPVQPVHGILLNPPFNQRGVLLPTRDKIRWPFGPPPRGNFNYGWLQHAYMQLAEGGVAVVLMPNKAVVSSRELKIRERMVEHGTVRCVISLPSKLFFGTPISATIWILQRPSGRSKNVLFIDAGTYGTDAGGRRHLEPDDVRRILDGYSTWLNQATTWQNASSATIEEIRAQNHSLNPADYLGSASETPRIDQASLLKHLTGTAARTSATAERATRTWSESRPPAGTRLAWRQLPLAAICDIQPGLGHDQVRAAGKVENGVPIVMIKNLRNGRIDFGDTSKIAAAKLEKRDRYRLREGDILCSRVGTTVTTVLVGEADAEAVVGDNLLRLRPMEDEVDPRYLLAVLETPETVGWISRRAAIATGPPSISRETLGQHMVALPPLAEQRRISEALRALDDLVDGCHSLTRLAEQARSALTGSYFEGALALDDTTSGRKETPCPRPPRPPAPPFATN